jgi:polyisoprenoid-binding protein YceI
MMKVAIITSRLAVALGLAFPLLAHAALSGTGTPSVSFTASGPGGMKIVGTTSDLSVASTPDMITVNVPLARLTTGIGLRDSHMRDKYLEVATYPAATLAVPRASLNVPQAGAQAEGDAVGTLTLHGRSKPTTFHYVLRHDGAEYAVTGALRANMKDFGIEVPVYLGVGVKPDVDVAVRFTAHEDP